MRKRRSGPFSRSFSLPGPTVRRKRSKNCPRCGTVSLRIFLPQRLMEILPAAQTAKVVVPANDQVLQWMIARSHHPMAPGLARLFPNLTRRLHGKKYSCSASAVGLLYLLRPCVYAKAPQRPIFPIFFVAWPHRAPQKIEKLSSLWHCLIADISAAKTHGNTSCRADC